MGEKERGVGAGREGNGSKVKDNQGKGGGEGK